MVADASGRSAIFEWVAGTDATDTDGSARQLVITYNDQDAQIGENEGSSNAQWVTNSRASRAPSLRIRRG